MKIPEPRKLKSGTWFLQMRLNGVSVPVSAPTKQECVNTARLIKAEHKAGKRRISRSMLTLYEAAENYTSVRKNTLSPSTIKTYNWIGKNAFPSIKNTPLSKVTNWQAVIDEAAAKYSPSTVKLHWVFVCTVMSDLGLPEQKVKLPQAVEKDKPFLAPDQIPIFVKAIHGEPCEIAALLALHSLRVSEIKGLTWEDSIDLKKETIYVRGSVVTGETGEVHKRTNKTPKSRREIPIMIPELTAALKAVPKKDRKGYVVQYGRQTIWAQINAVCEKNGLPLVGVHGLRRSFASLAFSAQVGMTEREVMEIGGWENAATVHKIYEQISKKQLETASAKMKAFYQNANENANGSKKT